MSAPTLAIHVNATGSGLEALNAQLAALRANAAGLSSASLQSPLATLQRQMASAVAKIRASASETSRQLEDLTNSLVGKRAISTVPKQIKDIGDASANTGAKLKGLSLDMHDAHAAARGLAGGFGQLWLTYGNVAPLIAGAAVASSFKNALVDGAKFSESLFVIRELAGNSTKEVANLASAALEMGRSTQYGAQEAVKGMEILSLAGLKATEVLAAIRPTLNFAAAGGVGTEKAAETLVAVSTAYGISANNFSFVADVIAKTAADTMASVSSMSESFKAASVIAQQYGVTLEDTSKVLGFLAQIGIQGSAAGTAVRNYYTELGKGSGKIPQMLKTLGVEVLDVTTGKMRGLIDLSQQLVLSLSGKSADAQLAIMQRLSNERGGKAYSAIESGVYKEINSFDDAKVKAGAKSVYDLVAALEAQGKQAEASKLKIDTINLAFERLKKNQQESSASAVGFTFFASIEKGLTPLGQYEGLLASLKNNLITAFTGAEASLDGVAQKTSGASDALYVLGVRFREALNSDAARQGIESLVVGFTNAVSAVADITSAIWNNKEAVVATAAAYVLLPPIIAGVATAMGLAGASMGTLTALGTIAGTVVGGIGAAFSAPVIAVAALGAAVVGLGVYFASAGDEAEILAQREIAASRSARDKYIEDSVGRITADKLRTAQTLESMVKEIERLDKIQELREKGMVGERASAAIANEAAISRIRGISEETIKVAELTKARLRDQAVQAQSSLLNDPAAAAEIDNKTFAALAVQDQIIAQSRNSALTGIKQVQRVAGELRARLSKEAEQAKAEASASGRRFSGAGTNPEAENAKAAKSAKTSSASTAAGTIEVEELNRINAFYKAKEDSLKLSLNSEAKLLKAKYDAGAESEGNYLANLLRIDEEQGRKTIELATQRFNEGELAIATARVVAQQKYGAGSTQMADVLTKEATLREANKSQLDKETEAVKRLIKEREELAYWESAKAINKANTSAKEYLEKERLELEKVNALLQARQDLAGGNPAELAAFEARNTALAQHETYLISLKKAYEDAAKTASDFNNQVGPRTAAELGAGFGYDRQRDAAKSNYDTARGTLTRDADTAGQQALETAYANSAKTLKGSMVDAIVTGMTEGSEKGSEAARKLIEEAFLRKPLRMFIEGFAEGGFDRGISALGGSALGDIFGIGRKGKPGGAGGGIKDFDPTAQSVENYLQTFSSGLGTSLETSSQGLQNLFQGFDGGLGETFSQAASMLSDMFSGQGSGSSGAGGWVSLIASLFAKGGQFGAGVTPFASGGSFQTNSILSSPTLFKFAKGLGVAGEAGPEAVMPLARDSQGRLGVRGGGGGGGGASINYAPTIHIDSRTDRAEVYQSVQESLQQNNKALMDHLAETGVVAR